MGFSRAGKILAGLILIYTLFLAFSNIMILFNGDLLSGELIKKGVAEGSKEASLYVRSVIIEIIRLIISAIGLILIVAGKDYGPSLYLSAVFTGVIMMLLGGNYYGILLELAVGFSLLLILFYADSIKEKLSKFQRKE